MKKTLLLGLLILCLCFMVNTAYAGTFMQSVQAIDVSDQTTDISVSEASVVYTQSKKVNSAVYFGVSYKALSATSTPDVKIELEQSFQAPTTEGAADVTYVEAEDASDIETNLTSETWHHASLAPVPASYFRYKITGNGGNAADTNVYIYTNIQEFN